MLANGLREAWGVAATAPAMAAGVRAASFRGGGDKILATVTAGGDRGLLVIVRPDEAISATVAAVSKASSALGAEIFPFVEAGVAQRGLHLWCRRLDLLEAFVGFCEPFVFRCLSGEGIHVAFTVCFEEFKRLVSGGTDVSLAPAIVGLLGELTVLSELAAMSPKALQFWSYPTLERHDFRNGSVALEVKTTLRSQQGKPIVNISAVDQLEPPPGGSLFLTWMRFEKDQSGAITLARLLDDIAKYLSERDRAELRSRLQVEAESSGLQSASFAMQERRSYRVDGAFPRLAPARLVSGALDPGVGRVTYELDLSAARSFQCTKEEANRALVRGEERE